VRSVDRADAEGPADLEDLRLAEVRIERVFHLDRVPSRPSLDDTTRGVAVFRLQLSTEGLPTGFYACQVNVIDVVTGEFELPRLGIYVR
jgi:hypothetical protein